MVKTVKRNKEIVLICSVVYLKETKSVKSERAHCFHTA